MKQTWRWFGPKDPITIDSLLQAGVEGVVTALHDLPPGTVWPIEAIEARQQQIAMRADGSASGLKWDVVESLPVSESIKTGTGEWRDHIEAYRQSLANLAACGLRTVCYNFMPVLDWTRTSLRSKLPHGGCAMRFDLIDFAVFDLFQLERPSARADYPDSLCQDAERRFAEMTEERRDELEHTIVAGLPGANGNWTLDDVRRMLSVYHKIDAAQLRANMITFLELVVPVAADLGINLCCHPDDPPFSILGLPRIMSTGDDYALIMRAVDMPQNGITLCTGSMGVQPSVGFAQFIGEWGHRIHFAHLRNTRREGPAQGNRHSFFEAEHLSGDTDMVSVVRALLNEQTRRKSQGRPDWQIPMRPDHGQELLSDLGGHSLPGYPLIGRLRGLAELRGVMTALSHEISD